MKALTACSADQRRHVSHCPGGTLPAVLPVVRTESFGGVWVAPDRRAGRNRAANLTRAARQNGTLDERRRKNGKKGSSPQPKSAPVMLPAYCGAPTGAEIRKVKEGPFATYFALNTNCVQLADTILGPTGLDILAVNGIPTPAATMPCSTASLSAGPPRWCPVRCMPAGSPAAPGPGGKSAPFLHNFRKQKRRKPLLQGDCAFPLQVF